MILTLVSLMIALGGVLLLSRGGAPESISGLVYRLSEKHRWAWSVWLIAVALTLMVPLMNALGDWLAFIGWLVVVGVIGAAVTPIVNKENRWIHNFCGISAGILSQVCVWLLCPWWLLCWIILVPLVGGCFASLNDSEEMPCVADGRGLFVCECLCAVSLYGCLLVI